MKTKILILMTTFIIFSINILKAQDPTITITPTTLNMGDIEILATTDETHNFDVVIGADAGPTTIYVQVYKDDGSWGISPSFEVSVDGKSTWGNNKSFTPNTAGETRTIYVRCSPTANNTENYQSEIYVFAAANYDYIDQAYVNLVFPEMDMYGSIAVTAITDGDASPSTTDSTDFGNVAINATSKVTYTIKNNIFGPAFVKKGRLFLVDIGTNEYITIGGTDAAMFSVSSQPTMPIAYSGGTTTFKIAFTPTSSGTKSATISIGNNDTDENPYNFSIQGTGAASAPTVTTSAISNITCNSASGGGNVTADGGANVTDRGVCWNTSTDPTTSNSYTNNGNGTGIFSSSLTSLVAETHYYVRAYANNGTTGYGSNVNFWTLSTEPSTQASTVASTDKSGTTIDLSWNGATGADGYIILQKEGSTAPTATGVEDGIKYTSFTGLPSGTTVAAEVTSTSYQVTSLTASTEYSFTIIPFAKGTDDATYNYKIDGTLASITETTVSAAPSTQASGIKWGTISGNQMEISWTAGNGNGQILLMKANSATSNPVNGSTYTGSTTFGSGDEIGAGTYVVYFGSGSKGRVYVDNLSTGVEYYFKVLEYSGTGSQTAYNMDETNGHNVGNSESSTLPIELLSFTASLQQNGEVIINWTTASETNNDFFTIEKTLDLKNWETVSETKGAGNSLIENSYSVLDKNPFNGISYYRLKQTDFDGEFSYSDIVFINNDKSENPIVFEQPFKSGGLLQTILYNQGGKTLNIEIINLLGQAIYREEIKPQADTHFISLNMNKFSNGIYLLRVSNETDFLVKKFLN